MKERDFGSDYEKNAWTMFQMSGNPYLMQELLNERKRIKGEIEREL